MYAVFLDIKCQDVYLYICEQHTAEDGEHRQSMEVMRDLMAGKTAPASLMQCSYVCYAVGNRHDSVGMPGQDGSIAVMKPYRSAPNIDLLQDAEPSWMTRSSEAEDIQRLQEVKPNYSIDKLQCRSIPEIIVVDSNNKEVTVVESCANTHQPDIVQSTKSGSLTCVVQPLPPVAPPRRKKTKTPSPLPTNTAVEVRLFMTQFGLRDGLVF